jgi:DNA-directed RNA polymerase I subunit RPA2
MKHENGKQERYQKRSGNLPIMVKVAFKEIPLRFQSQRCRLSNLKPKELVQHHEEQNEMGGYFIVNGIEKIIRLLIVPRRNDVTSVVRPSFKRIGATYSPYATIIRCVRADQTR